MKKSFRKRIRNIDKYLQSFLNQNNYYHLGLLFEDYLESPLLSKYGLPTEFINDNFKVPLAIGSVTLVNSEGKFIRKKPTEKEPIIKRVAYIRESDGRTIKYDRIFYIYKKVLLHKYQAGLYFLINDHNQKVVVSEKLNYSQKYLTKGTHIANMLCEIFNDFEVFDENLNLAINFNTSFDKIILPSGNLNNDNYLKDLLKIGNRFLKNEEERKAFQKRLQVLIKYNPTIKGKGPEGFYGYIVFGFSDLDIVILETMYAGNATYIFSTDDFENKIIKDKQTVLKNQLHLARFFHYDDWEYNLKKFMDEKIKKCNDSI